MQVTAILSPIMVASLIPSARNDKESPSQDSSLLGNSLCTNLAFSYRLHCCTFHVPRNCLTMFLS